MARLAALIDGRDGRDGAGPARVSRIERGGAVDLERLSRDEVDALLRELLPDRGDPR